VVNARRSGFHPGTGVVFTAVQVKELLHQCSRGFPEIEGTWKPTAEQIARLEPKLAEALTVLLAQHPSEGAPKPGIADYYRQYGGVIVHGRRLIYVNGFRSGLTKDDHWKHEVVNVCDGGISFFGAAFDTETKTFMNLQSGVGGVQVIQFNGMG